MNQNLFISTCATVRVRKGFLYYWNVSQIEFVKAYCSIDIILPVSDLFLSHSCSQFYIFVGVLTTLISHSTSVAARFLKS